MAKKMLIKRYTVRHPVTIEAGKDKAGNMILHDISSDDAEENLLIGGDGEFVVWDADIVKKGQNYVISGGDSPGGGCKAGIVLTVPIKLVKEILFEEI